VRVLVVDDHPSFRRSARLLLEAEGWSVVGEAADAAGAVREAQALKPDLVLLDVNLPDGDGRDVARELAAADGAPRIVLVSSRAPADFAPLGPGDGAVAFLAKGELSAAALAAALGG
jgi:DNA-binding NarL/FixJ family response regulator